MIVLLFPKCLFGTFTTYVFYIPVNCCEYFKNGEQCVFILLNTIDLLVYIEQDLLHNATINIKLITKLLYKIYSSRVYI